MPESKSTATIQVRESANRTLRITAVFWFITAVLGQWFFVAYLLLFYGKTGLQGNLAAWNKIMPHGYVPGDDIGNMFTVTHISFAVVILLGGPLQLIPKMRARFPKFHRWNGRFYMVTVIITALVGLYMMWVRNPTGNLVQHIGLSVDAMLIVIFSALALRYAMAGKIATHRRWALRLFLVVSAVWFFRVGVMLWFLLTGGIGIDVESFSGPFISFLAFGQYLVPLAILEMYFFSQTKTGTRGKFIMAAILFISTILMGIGIFVATMGLWLPNM